MIHKKDPIGEMHAEEATQHLQARREEKEDSEELRPYAGRTAARAAIFQKGAQNSIDAWMERVRKDKNPPNEQQHAFLKGLADRLKTEIIEELMNTKGNTKHEPMLDLVHGLPGTGKTRVIEWMRDLFQEALGWEHGVQFVMLAFQNSMAANINGLTIHNWASIPVHAEAGRSGTTNATNMSTKCQSLRFVVIDEISMVSAQLLAQLEIIVTKAIRKTRSTYKVRDTDKSIRAFGGVNVILLGDWWQLRPVGGDALSGNPFLVDGGLARSGLDLFWNTGLDTIRHLWELTLPMRCDDKWYNKVLTKCRFGRLDLNTYCLLHGLPTLTPAGWEDNAHTQQCSCTKEADLMILPGTTNDYYKEAWANLFLEGWSGKDIISSQKELAHSECAACTCKRHSFKRVLPHGPVPDTRLHEEPFASAPAIFSYNNPKYFAMHLRAREFAKTHKRELSWAIARDLPLFSEDRALPKEKLRTKLCNWLLNHDQKTGHITSIMPLCMGLPVRLTESIDRKRQLYRNRSGNIVGWAPHPHQTKFDVDGEWLLDNLPQCIYIKFQGATWRVHEDLGEGVYPLAPVSRTWEVNKYTKIKARRTGFFVVPDFASTAHMIQGASLDAVLCSCPGPEEKTSPSDQIAGYVSFSRAKKADKVYAIQPFSPWLFQHGSPKGPDLLMRKLRGDISAKQASDKWKGDRRMESGIRQGG